MPIKVTSTVPPTNGQVRSRASAQAIGMAVRVPVVPGDFGMKPAPNEVAITVTGHAGFPSTRARMPQKRSFFDHLHVSSYNYLHIAPQEGSLMLDRRRDTDRIP